MITDIKVKYYHYFEGVNNSVAVTKAEAKYNGKSISAVTRWKPHYTDVFNEKTGEEIAKNKLLKKIIQKEVKSLVKEHVKVYNEKFEANRRLDAINDKLRELRSIQSKLCC